MKNGNMLLEQKKNKKIYILCKVHVWKMRQEVVKLT